MFAGFGSVIEVGCADAFGTRIVAQSVERVVATDVDPIFIEDCNARAVDYRYSISFKELDVLDSAQLLPQIFDGIYALDVFEHIDPNYEDSFISNCSKMLSDAGVMICGIPSLESQKYASPPSKEGHVNCKSGEDFKVLFSKHFANVFLFSMNDEVVHTGFSPMANYLLVLCCGPKNRG